MALFFSSASEVPPRHRPGNLSLATTHLFPRIGWEVAGMSFKRSRELLFRLA
jgi:hypothetical protein